MLTKTLRCLAVAGVSLVAAVGFTSTATAQTATTTPDINIGNDLCALPWFWQGPINTAVGDQNGSYAACNGDAATSTEGINIGNDLCALPWFWQGPINFLVGSQEGHYQACNG